MTWQKLLARGGIIAIIETISQKIFMEEENKEQQIN